MKTKKPEVFLMTHTENPVKAVSLAVSAWTSDNFIEDFDEVCYDDALANLDKAQKAFHRTALEYVDMVFVIKNVSRAFQQQLTRTRLASFSIQSMRVVTKNGFASNGHYTMPPSLTDNQKESFHNSMLKIQDDYHALIDKGAKVEDARGLLPLNIHSDVSMRINMNALYHMTGQRLCVNTQWEYRQVVLQMKQLIEKEMGSVFSDRIEAPCIHARKCPMREEYCGVPVWKLAPDERVEIYDKYISQNNKLGSEKEIIWSGDVFWLSQRQEGRAS